jgi:membrane protease YdiL (CAAX protease family)
MSTLRLGKRRKAAPALPAAVPAVPLVLAGYVSAIAAAEAIGLLAGPTAGAVAYALILLVAANHCALLRARPGDAGAGAMASLGLVALLRLLSVTLPVTDFDRAAWYMLVSELVLAGVVVAGPLPRAEPAAGGQRELGRAAAWTAQALAGAVALGAAVGAWLVLRPTGLVAPGATSGRLALAVAAVAAVAVAGVTEELVFRGCLQPQLVAALGARGVAWTAGVSALIYAGANSPALVGIMAALGLALGWAVQRSGSVLGAALAHAAFNVVLLVICPLWLG